jgi:lysyl-tRNA synthetase, class II
MALSRFAAIEDADCLIVQARNFVGELVAVLHFVPWGHDGLSLDLVRRQPDLENGVMELMIAELLAAARSRGVSRVSLNFAVCRSSLARGERIGAGPLLRPGFGCRWLHPDGGRLPPSTGQMPTFGQGGSPASSASD